MTDIVKHQPLDFVTSGSHPGSSWILYSNTKSPAAVSLVTGTTLNMIIMKLNNQIRKLKKKIQYNLADCEDILYSAKEWNSVDNASYILVGFQNWRPLSPNQ